MCSGEKIAGVKFDTAVCTNSQLEASTALYVGSTPSSEPVLLVMYLNMHTYMKVLLHFWIVFPELYPLPACLR